MTKRHLKSEKARRIEAALARLEVLFKKSPDTILRLHLKLNRQKGMKLLSYLMACEDPFQKRIEH